MFSFISKSFEETVRFAKCIGGKMRGGEVIALNGELGAGKTAFVKGLALGLDIDEDILSPTFVIVREYTGKLKLNHFDVYRISNPNDMYDIGFDEYISGGGVNVIEWASNIEKLLPENSIHIDIAYLGDNKRKIDVSCEKDLEGVLNDCSCH